MDFHELSDTINLRNLSNMGINYELWYKNDNGERTFMAASERVPIDPVSYEFSINNLTWYLDVFPADGWIDYEETAVVFCVIFAVALLIVLLLLNRGQIKKPMKSCSAWLIWTALPPAIPGIMSTQYCEPAQWFLERS